MVLPLEITFGKVVLIVGIIGSFLIYMGINSGFFFQEADGTYYCAKSCQAKLKEQEDRANQTLNKPKNVEPCYGIYCNKPKPSEKDPAQTKIIPTTQSSQVIPLGRNYIAIRISESCESIDYCPNIKDRSEKFDNSNRYLSGDFKFDNKTNK